MQILLTFDYELFFGKSSGTIENCMISPTKKLLQIAQKHKIPLCFFVDIGYYIKLKEFETNFPDLSKDREAFEKQIQEMVALGHDVQLHIHPHWEKAEYHKQGWQIQTSHCYKLDDFEQEEAEKIIIKYKEALDLLIQRKTHTFRAGGWCIQPFNRWVKTFRSLGIKIDSSVFPGAYIQSDNYQVDFRNAPQKDYYFFENAVEEENIQGSFLELPISEWYYSPFFYWRLYLLGKLFPSKHKMMGDGSFISQGSRKWNSLTRYTWNHASIDGYFTEALNRILKHKIKKKHTYFNLIGHPKGMTKYSLKKLDLFIEKNKKNHSFITFDHVLENHF